MGVTPMPTTLDDSTRASLVLAAGDPANHEARAAFAECYERLIRRWCRGQGLQPADQDDVVQTILCRLFQMLPEFHCDPKKSFTRYSASWSSERSRTSTARGLGAWAFAAAATRGFKISSPTCQPPTTRPSRIWCKG